MESQNNLNQEQNNFINKATIAGGLGPVYALASGLYREFWLFFIPFYNIYLLFKLIIKGRQMAWEKSEKNYERFEFHQKKLSQIAKILLGIIVCFYIVWFGVFFTFLFSGNGSDVARNFSQNLFTTGQIEDFISPEFTQNQEVADFDRDTRGNYEKTSFYRFSTTSDKAQFEGSVKFTNTSIPICLDLVKIGEEWKVSEASFVCPE